MIGIIQRKPIKSHIALSAMQPSLWYILPISQRTGFLTMKNPAILLYTADFLIGTASFTDEEVGQYARALFYQHQEGGYLSDDFINRMFPTGLFPVVKSKFKESDKGLYNERMKEEIERRNRYSLSRSNNKRKKGKPLSNKRVTRKTYDVEKSSKFQQHMETETETENENKDVKDIYNSYPSKCPVKGSSTGKCNKNKKQIKKLLKIHTPKILTDLIKKYIQDCTDNNRYIKNFTTFLNNLPDPEQFKEVKEDIKLFDSELYMNKLEENQ